ncbi:DUF1963 domain-containing protein [Anabaena cylindrica FACHB-243]|uniref:DUF1963 domain-containing protein n=1 Tax=Anabaena cylindrica (strain ATCC 27899 / PCC 7122) TaxID=272123 RepID=K9ZIB6_ANACC|nr:MULTISPECIES: DUF1963 domain-containing protein [Anabaena]AFZ58509.1 protein of unknown function DUF1963 [Anabaena cylindrica PCC 7122]MBD2417271.1 DUF1963 domain-containing protein [Anabaena cylindrica FACHB-243]MBY5281392.1 DUF1963 domain-containing protein [Anabaena sp. CCAP 1446/1C]MBY5310217.1 DUF1963 domain-containing protein [Anabaena sp. CCAP 1446/1C]MCM2410039.1 DUF1963 domain-containing protein [Anabaena sp. CCAP 1446/1C]
MMNAENIVHIPQIWRDFPPEFEELRPFIESQLLPYIKISSHEVGQLKEDSSGDPLKLWHSKIGGNPYLPKDYEHPCDRITGDIMPLLMQVNCADVPQIAGFDFPQQGILQFYLGYDAAMSELSPEVCRVLYFPEVLEVDSELVTDFSFIDNEDTLRDYSEIYALEFSVAQELFWYPRHEEIQPPEALTDLYEEFSLECDEDCSGDKLGGFADTSCFDVGAATEGIKGRLLLELGQTSCNGEYFYFFIEDADLRNRDFSKVECRIMFT